VSGFTGIDKVKERKFIDKYTVAVISYEKKLKL